MTQSKVILKDPEVFYFRVIEHSKAAIFVFGDDVEQWTRSVLSFFESNSVPIFLFPWFKIQQLRVSLELVYYPVTQYWIDSSLKKEVVGYNNEELLKLLDLYHFDKQKKGKNYG